MFALFWLALSKGFTRRFGNTSELRSERRFSKNKMRVLHKIPYAVRRFESICKGAIVSNDLLLSKKPALMLAAFWTIAFAVIASIAFSSSYAHADTLSSPNGKKVIETSGKLVKKKGSVYYKYKKVVTSSDNSSKVSKKTKGKTKTAKGFFLQKGKKSYYFDKKGKMATGWIKIGSDYYFFNRSNGVQSKGTKKRKAVVDKIKIRKDGKAVKTKYNVEKIKVMMKARKVMLANTKYTDSKATKRLKMFRWVMKGNYRQFRTLKSTGHRKGWELLFANDMFDKNRLGCCVSNASAFAFLAKECGYKDVRICDDTGHAFVMINGKYFDTLFAEVNGFHNYYNAPHSRARKDFLANSLKI